MRVTIASITARREPRFDWLLADLVWLARPGDELELLVIDGLGRDLPALVGGRGSSAASELAARAGCEIRVFPVKPNILQGPHRVTSRDLFANATARNTALCLARHDYLVFLDDRCRLGEAWLETVRRGSAARSSVLCGPYDKIVPDYPPTGRTSRRSVDHRRAHAPKGKRDCGGSWCYGGNLALPLAWALEVGGFEEGCDPVGCEDYVLGRMLENRGHRIDFEVAMSVEQDRYGTDGDELLGDLFEHHPFLRIDKGVSPNDKSHAINRRFLSRRHTELTPDLIALRDAVQAEGYQAFPIPDPAADPRDWYDGRPIREMVDPA